MVGMTMTSPAFQNGEPIPLDYTADGRNVSPPLQWSHPPAGTKSFVLLCEDPDAPSGTFVHWAVYEIPPETRQLREAALPEGAVEGINNFGEADYGGPAPPKGALHHYHFRLFALDAPLPLIGEVSAESLKSELIGHVLAETELVGTYQRVAR
jgi:Raf kinase inhibitor-like YbhB/YbcL family protein